MEKRGYGLLVNAVRIEEFELKLLTQHLLKKFILNERWFKAA